MSLSLKRISCIQQNTEPCLHIQSVSLGFFASELSPLMLRDIKVIVIVSPCYFLL